MRNELIPDSKVEEAFAWLHENADACAEARAHRIYIVEFRKTLKAQLMQQHGKETVGIQEREAYASKDYLDHLNALRIAVANDEKLQFIKQTKFALIEAWRTSAANRRASI